MNDEVDEREMQKKNIYIVTLENHNYVQSILC